MSSNEKMVGVPAWQLKKWQVTALEFKIDSIGVEIMHVLNQPAEQHQGEPVALPARRDINQADNFKRGTAHGFNACLVEIAKLGPLYTHADTGEVERLLAENASLRDGWYKDESDNNRYWPEEIEELRAQLTERDALLGRVVNSGALSCEQYEELEADCCALSTSAEPSAPASFIACHVDESCGQSAPVGRDERAAFEAEMLQKNPDADFDLNSSGNYIYFYLECAWSGWQARADLERKP